MLIRVIDHCWGRKLRSMVQGDKEVCVETTELENILTDAESRIQVFLPNCVLYDVYCSN